jgi:excinuclease UvrABC ATPase subunit
MTPPGSYTERYIPCKRCEGWGGWPEYHDNEEVYVRCPVCKGGQKVLNPEFDNKPPATDGEGEE